MVDLKGPARIVQNRAKKGLFAGSQIRTGNNVSHSHRRSRRTFEPNTHYKNLYSNILQKSMRIEVTCSALRTIDKYGGLDNYILNIKQRHFKGQDFALSLRQQLLAAQAQLQPQNSDSGAVTQQQNGQQTQQATQ